MLPHTHLPRRRLVRLRNYDYTQAGIYFVTICTHERVLYFDDPRLHAIAAERWQATPAHAHGVHLDEWVVMPNHVHGLLAFEPETVDQGREDSQHIAPAPGQELARKSPPRRSLAVVVRGYKAAVTGACRTLGLAFAWQANYFEHIGRDGADLDNIRRYIRENPLKWELDSEHPNNRAR